MAVSQLISTFAFTLLMCSGPQAAARQRRSLRQLQAPRGPGAAAKFRQVLHNREGLGMEYDADLSVGGQALSGILDTGSYELLVFSTRCASCGDAASLYNASASPTLQRGHLRTMHSFGSGDTWSQLAFEDVELGPMKAERQYFWEVTQAALATSGGFQAIVGLGPPSTPRRDSLALARRVRGLQRRARSQPGRLPEAARARGKEALALPEAPPLLESLGVLAFSVCLGRAQGSDGHFVWHDDEPRHQGPGSFATVPVAGEATWGVRLARARLAARGSAGAEDVPLACAEGCGAIVDSGTSLLVVPTPVAERALAELNKLDADCNDLSSLPHLTFELGDEVFHLPPDAYIGVFVGELPSSLQGYAKRHHMPTTYHACELLLMTMDVSTQFGPMWILGMPFFREYYTTFDLGKGRGARSLVISKANGGCEPDLTASLQEFARHRNRHDITPRQVDVSKLRVPHWLTKRSGSGI